MERLGGRVYRHLQRDGEGRTAVPEWRRTLLPPAMSALACSAMVSLARCFFKLCTLPIFCLNDGVLSVVRNLKTAIMLVTVY